jgi:hypothetical protein
VAFVSLVVSILSLGTDIAGLGNDAVSRPPERQPPSDSVCNYNLATSPDQTYPEGFDAGSTIVQLIPPDKLGGLEAITFVGPVIDYDARNVYLAQLKGITFEITENETVIRRAEIRPSEIKSVSANPDEFTNIPIDPRKKYALVINNTTTQNITLYINQLGPTDFGYPTAVRDNQDLRGSVAGRICGRPNGG